MSNRPPIGYMPAAFPGIAPFPCLTAGSAKPLQVFKLCPDAFPLFPNTATNFTLYPTIWILEYEILPISDCAIVQSTCCIPHIILEAAYTSHVLIPVRPFAVTRNAKPRNFSFQWTPGFAFGLIYLVFHFWKELLLFGSSRFSGTMASAGFSTFSHTSLHELDFFHRLIITHAGRPPKKRGAIALTPPHKDEIRLFKWIIKIRYINRHHH